jgi:hypothetical protein
MLVSTWYYSNTFLSRSKTALIVIIGRNTLRIQRWTVDFKLKKNLKFLTRGKIVFLNIKTKKILGTCIMKSFKWILIFDWFDFICSVFTVIKNIHYGNLKRTSLLLNKELQSIQNIPKFQNKLKQRHARSIGVMKSLTKGCERNITKFPFSVFQKVKKFGLWCCIGFIFPPYTYGELQCVNIIFFCIFHPWNCLIAK